MSGSTRPVDPSAALARANRRIDTLERRLRALEQQFKPEATFSYDGPLIAASSPLWRRREKGRLVNVVGSLVSAGSTDTRVAIYKNGDSIGTLVMPAGLTFGQLHLSVLFSPEDTVQDEIVSPGGGAAGLTVQHRWAGSTS